MKIYLVTQEYKRMGTGGKSFEVFNIVVAQVAKLQPVYLPLLSDGYKYWKSTKDFTDILDASLWFSNNIRECTSYYEWVVKSGEYTQIEAVY